MGRNDEGHGLDRSHRRRYLLSGLLICGCSGGNFSIVTRDTYSCSGRRAKGVCNSVRTISREEIESRILTVIKQNLLTPELVAEFTCAYTREFNRLVADAVSQQAEVAGRLAAVERRIAGVMRAIEEGMYQRSMKARLTELEAEKAGLMSRQAPAPVIPSVSVHPNLAAVYQRKVEELESLLVDADNRDAAMEAIRWLIDSITLTPRQDGPGLEALLKGDLARLLVLCVAGSGQTKTPAAFAVGGFKYRWLRGPETTETYQHPASELGKTLLELLTIVVRGGLFDLRLDLRDTGFDVRLLAGAVDDRGAFLVDADPLGAAQHVERHALGNEFAAHFNRTTTRTDSVSNEGIKGATSGGLRRP